MSRLLQLNRGKLALSGVLLVIGAAAAVILLQGSTVADFTTRASDADFDLGVSKGVNHDAPNGNQLRLYETGATLSLMWVANAGKDNVSKIDTNTGQELVIHDSGSITTEWGTVSWTEPVPDVGVLEAKVRVAETEGDLTGQDFEPVSNGVPFTATGRFIEIQAKFIANEGLDFPILFDIDLEFAPPGGYVAPEE